jgi:hypothetical protein
MRRPQRIPQRRRIFLGCEGESEQSYGALLRRLVEVRHRRIHLDTVLLRPGGGDPLALMERAVQLMGQRVSRGGNYAAKAVLLDCNGCGQSHDRDRRAHALAEEHGLRLIWQEPCHEGLLLRHLDGCDAFRPATSDQALSDLQRHWPEYRKATPASRLAVRIDENGVRRAAAVEHALQAFLMEIEFERD